MTSQYQYQYQRKTSVSYSVSYPFGKMVYYWSTTAYKTSHCRLFSQRAESHVSAYVYCSQLNVKSYSNPYYQTNCSSYHRLFLPQCNVEVHSAPDHFLLNLQVADEISKRILILSFHITQQLWSCFQI